MEINELKRQSRELMRSGNLEAAIKLYNRAWEKERSIKKEEVTTVVKATSGCVLISEGAVELDMRDQSCTFRVTREHESAPFKVKVRGDNTGLDLLLSPGQYAALGAALDDMDNKRGASEVFGDTG